LNSGKFILAGFVKMKNYILIIILIVMSVVALHSDSKCQTLEPVGYFDTPDWPWSVKIDGNYAYIACDSAGVVIADITDASHPRLVSAFDTPGIAYDVDVIGDILYVADNTSFRVYDITDRHTPELIGSYASASIFVVHVVDNIAYIGREYRSPSLLLLDITDPSNPDSLSGLSFLGGAFDLFCAGDYVYTLSNVTEPYSNFLRLINVADPESPYIESNVQLPGNTLAPLDIKVSGDYAYIAGRIYGLQIVDISNPGNPVLVRDFNTYGSTDAVAVCGNYIFLTDSFGYVYLIDNHDPLDQILLDIAIMHWDGISIIADDSYVYVTNDDNLLVVYSYSTTGLEPSVLNPTEFSLGQNYPNPFNASTTIGFALSRAGNIRLEIYDILGREIATLLDDFTQPGEYQITFDASKYPSGVYYYRLQADSQNRIRKMILLK